MDNTTRSTLGRQAHHTGTTIGVLKALIAEGHLAAADRNVSAALSGLESAHENLRRLVMDLEHPDAIAARQAGAWALRKLGYDMNKWGFLDPDATITIDPDNPPVSGQHRLTAMAAESAAPVVKMPDLAEITERFSEPGPANYCPNCQGNIAKGARLEDHAAPCTLCGSDGHAACQHAD